MNTTDFWNLVNVARADAGKANSDRYDAFASALVDRLAATSKETIFEFRQVFEQFHSAIYRWDMWAAAYLIGGSCSDDAFMDFRAGLIAQGQDWYERAASYAYERINGDEDNCSFYDDYEQFLGPQPERGLSDMGEAFDFDDNAEMHARLPKLAALFKP